MVMRFASGICVIIWKMNLSIWGEIITMQQITFPNSKFKIRYPSVIVPIISFSIMLILHIRLLVILMKNDNISWSLFYIECIPLLILVIWLTLMIFRAFIKPAVLHINPESLFINGRTIEAKQIKIVMVMGYFKPILGIKPTNKKNVPTHLCFRFMEEEDKGMKELKSWAELNQIPFVHKRFGRL
ncbi:hypothetical protein SAMN05421578_11270 [Paenibacillus macquariensis]|uniref:Uncharacterized protein n=2 Tax=Paenibacillus macquariensis TaxID=948756 RepID=A0ABY1K7Q6_9BACL|nr:hypothetical protein SAMN05421578_11270 [Paenibacillus macquariensis]